MKHRPFSLQMNLDDSIIICPSCLINYLWGFVFWCFLQIIFNKCQFCMNCSFVIKFNVFRLKIIMHHFKLKIPFLMYVFLFKLTQYKKYKCNYYFKTYLSFNKKFLYLFTFIIICDVSLFYCLLCFLWINISHHIWNFINWLYEWMNYIPFIICLPKIFLLYINIL